MADNEDDLVDYDEEEVRLGQWKGGTKWQRYREIRLSSSLRPMTEASMPLWWSVI